MPRVPKAIVPDEPVEESPAWSAVVLMASCVAAFALFSLFLANNHRWTDALLARLPAPHGTLASDGVMAEQLRIADVHTEHMTLSDRSVALLFAATVINDASIPARGIRLQVQGFRDGNLVATGQGTCGKNVSVRLLRRLSHDEVSALMEMSTEDEVLAPGARTDCQVALTQLRTEIEEVSYEVATAEPTTDHPPVDSDPDRSGDPRRGE